LKQLLQIFTIVKNFYKICENFRTCGGYILPSIKNINLDFYLNIRWKNGVSMKSLIPWSWVRRFWVDVTMTRLGKFLDVPEKTCPN
jgi:hypothetical protein